LRFIVEIALRKHISELKPNLLAVVSISDMKVKDAIAVPAELVQQEVSGRFYVLSIKKQGEDTIAIKKYVESGETYQEQILIKNGLTAGEEIIVKGALGLTEGERVKIITD